MVDNATGEAFCSKDSHYFGLHPSNRPRRARPEAQVDVEARAASPTPSPVVPVPINHIGRITGVFFNPKETFTDIARRPSWLVPIIVLTILSICVSILMNQKIDWDSYIRKQAERSPRFEQLSEEQKQTALGPQIKITYYATYAAGVLIPGVFALILTLVYWGIFNGMAGAQFRFGQVYGLVAHASMPSAIASVLIIITLALRPYGESTPENMLASSLHTFLPGDAPRWLQSLGGSVELFWIWTMILFVIGFSAANPKKISFGKGLSFILGIWIVYVAIKVGLAAAFS